MIAKATQTRQIQISELTLTEYEALERVLDAIYDSKIILNSPNDLSIAVLSELFVEKFCNKLTPKTNSKGLITMTWKVSQVLAFRKVIGFLGSENQYINGFMQDVSYKFADALMQIPSITAPSLLQQSQHQDKKIISDGR